MRWDNRPYGHGPAELVKALSFLELVLMSNKYSLHVEEVNAAHHWRGAADARYANWRPSPLPVNVPG